MGAKPARHSFCRYQNKPSDSGWISGWKTWRQTLKRPRGGEIPGKQARDPSSERATSAPPSHHQHQGHQEGKQVQVSPKMSEPHAFLWVLAQSFGHKVSHSATQVVNQSVMRVLSHSVSQSSNQSFRMDLREFPASGVHPPIQSFWHSLSAREAGKTRGKAGEASGAAVMQSVSRSGKSVSHSITQSLSPAFINKYPCSLSFKHRASHAFIHSIIQPANST